MIAPKYKVGKKQKLFHQAIERFVAICGGVQSGKTYAGAKKGTFSALGKDPFLGDLKCPSVGMIVGPNYPNFILSTRPTFFQALEDFGLLPGRDYTYKIAERSIVFNNGSIVYLRSADKPDSLRGPPCDWIWIDEGSLISIQAWLILLGRVTQTGGKIWITTTPKGENWLKYYFVDLQNPNYKFVTCSSYDNPVADTESIRMIEEAYALYGNDWVRQEIYGEFRGFQGNIYSMFSEKLHCYDFDISDKGITLYKGNKDDGFDDFIIKGKMNWIYCIDWANATVTAVVFGCIIGETLFIYDELYLENMSETKILVPDIIKMIREKTGDRNHIALIDPASAQTIYVSKQNINEKNILAMFRADHKKWKGENIKGLKNLIPANNQVGAGIQRVKELMGINVDIGIPNFIIHKTNCPNTIKEHRFYQWDKKIKDGSILEKPKKVKDHTCDSVRYIANYMYIDFLKRPLEMERVKRMIAKSGSDWNKGLVIDFDLEAEKKENNSGYSNRKYNYLGKRIS